MADDIIRNPQGSRRFYFRRGTPFWDRVDKSGGPDACWPWMSSRKQGGYGQFWEDGKKDGAHRISYRFVKDQNLPDDIDVLHTCDNPPCCNPAHLFTGTAKDNVDDMIKKGRAKRGTTSGEAHWKCKITKDEVSFIRIEYENGRLSTVEIAAMFGISRNYAWCIVKGKFRRHG